MHHTLSYLIVMQLISNPQYPHLYVPSRLDIQQGIERTVQVDERSGNRCVIFFDRSECHIFPSVAMPVYVPPMINSPKVTNTWTRKDETFNYLFVGYKKKLIQYVNKD